MALAYELKPDDKGWGMLYTYEIDAIHLRHVPGIRCPICGAWGMTGSIYPSVDAATLNTLFLPEEPYPISLEEFKTLAATVEAVLGPDRPVQPGTHLGVLRGTARGRIGDFAWVNPWTPLLRESVWRELGKAGINLDGVRAELAFEKEPHEPLIELEALPRVRVPRDLVPDKCSVCGRLGMKVPDTIVLTADSFDSSIPLQRIAELPTVLVVNESFAQFIRQRHLRDAALTPIEVR
jgi:uncharacterized double-CXXCG motif protein